MLRFRSRAKPVITGRNRWRLWMLVIALGLVLTTMRQLDKPGTVRRIDRLFTDSQLTVDPVTLDTEAPVDETVNSLSQVKDNTYFRPAEHKAWFSLFEQLQQDDTHLTSETLGEVSYAQLLQQPEVYRGHVITILGKVLREEVEQPAENKLGIDSYHRLWIQPQGGGQWPFVVYCLELPTDFPRGENPGTPVSVTGFFFKNWSYAYQDGLGLAPVVLASKLDWEKPSAPPATNPITRRNWTIGITTACVFATFATWQALRHTRRRPHIANTDTAVEKQLQQLASREREA